MAEFSTFNFAFCTKMDIGRILHHPVFKLSDVFHYTGPPGQWLTSPKIEHTLTANSQRAAPSRDSSGNFFRQCVYWRRKTRLQFIKLKRLHDGYAACDSCRTQLSLLSSYTRGHTRPKSGPQIRSWIFGRIDDRSDCLGGKGLSFSTGRRDNFHAAVPLLNSNVHVHVPKMKWPWPNLLLSVGKPQLFAVNQNARCTANPPQMGGGPNGMSPRRHMVTQHIFSAFSLAAWNEIWCNVNSAGKLKIAK